MKKISEQRIYEALVAGTAIWSLLIAALLMFASFDARAGGGSGFSGATEMTQLANNVELALQSAEEMAQTYESVEQTYLSRMQQLATSVGEYTSPYQKVLDAHRKIVDARRAVDVLKNGLDGLKSALVERFRGQAASGLTWNQYVMREKSLIQSGYARSRAELEANLAVMESTEAAIHTYQRTAQALELTTGTHQANRIMGAQLAQIGGDLNKLIALTAQANATRAEEQYEKSAERESSANERESLRSAQLEANRRSRAVVDGWRGKR